MADACRDDSRPVCGQPQLRHLTPATYAASRSPQPGLHALHPQGKFESSTYHSTVIALVLLDLATITIDLGFMLGERAAQPRPRLGHVHDAYELRCAARLEPTTAVLPSSQGGKAGRARETCVLQERAVRLLPSPIPGVPCYSEPNPLSLRPSQRTAPSRT